MSTMTTLYTPDGARVSNGMPVCIEVDGRPLVYSCRSVGIAVLLEVAGVTVRVLLAECIQYKPATKRMLSVMGRLAKRAG